MWCLTFKNYNWNIIREEWLYKLFKCFDITGEFNRRTKRTNRCLYSEFKINLLLSSIWTIFFRIEYENLNSFTGIITWLLSKLIVKYIVEYFNINWLITFNEVIQNIVQLKTVCVPMWMSICIKNINIFIKWWRYICL